MNDFLNDILWNLVDANVIIFHYSWISHYYFETCLVSCFSETSVFNCNGTGRTDIRVSFHRAKCRWFKVEPRSNLTCQTFDRRWKRIENDKNVNWNDVTILILKQRCDYIVYVINTVVINTAVLTQFSQTLSSLFGD